MVGSMAISMFLLRRHRPGTCGQSLYSRGSEWLWLWGRLEQCLHELQWLLRRFLDGPRGHVLHRWRIILWSVIQ
jgi:hypothetical protein